MKKILALVLAFAMMFSTITVAFAEPEVSAEAKALATVGMLAGDGNGVTVEYTAKEMTRLTAAASLLKLKGLYADAVAFVGDANFADADSVKWAEGKNILAYLKANPGLGFGGNEKGEFNPNGNITEQSYYKVLLETLGYKQTTAEVAGDFAWEETLTFAEGKGLKAANAEKFTVDALAKATVAALKAEMKDGKVLINVLVEAGKVDKEKAVAAELMTDAVVAVAVDSVTAIGNTTVEVAFEDDVDAAALGNVGNYAIEGLEISAAVVAGTDTVRLETAAMTVGKQYTLTIGEEKVKFTGVAKITGAPKLDKVEGTDEQTVELTFDKALDFASATDVANYTIAGVTVVEAEVDEDVVTLTTEGLVANKNYTVKVTNIMSVDGGILKSTSKIFLAKTDKTAPKLDSAKAMTNTRVLVTFTEKVTEVSAENIANYTIKAGTNELAIEAIEMVEKNQVEITTAPQKSGTKYELVANNLVDRKVLANTMTKESKKTFYGKAVDKAAPTFTGIEYLSKTLVAVEFNDNSRLDFATVLDASNYTFNNDIDVESVVLEDADDNDCMTALLTVSELTINKLYKLSIANVADEYGNAMEEGKSVNSKSATFKTADLESAKVISVKASEKEIVVEFNKKLNSASAEEVANYSVNNDVLVPVEAEYDATDRTVTLTTGVELTAGKTYKLTVDGLLDLAGNALKSTNSFVASATSIDTDAPSVEYIEALNNNVIAVTFDEEMAAAGTIKLDLDDVADYEVTLEYVDSSDDDTVLYFSKTDRTGIFANGTDGERYDVEYQTGMKDVAGNPLKTVTDADLLKVYANTDAIDDIVLEGVEQTQVNEFKLIFSDKIDGDTLATHIDNVAGPSNNSNYATGLSVEAEIDSDDATIVYVTGNFKLDKTYRVQIEADVLGIFGEKVLGEIEDTDKNQYVDLYAALEDEDAPVIEKVEAKYNNQVIVTYNESLSDRSYRYEILDDDDKTVETIIGVVDDNLVKLNLASKKLVNGEMYTLIAKSPVYDIAGNKTTVDLDDEYYFEGTNLVKAGTIITVNVVNRGTIKVVTNSGYLPEVTMAVYNGNNKLATSTKVAAEKSSYTWVVSNVVFVDGVNYDLWLGNEEVASFTGLAEVFINGTTVAGKKATLYSVKGDVGSEEKDAVLDSVLADDQGNYEFSVTNGKYFVVIDDATSTLIEVADADATVVF